MRDGVIITSSYLTGEQPFRSERYDVQGIECKTEHGEFNYCDGLQKAWITDKTVVNVEHDMEFSDELVDGLVDCPWPLCAYAYEVYPTALARYIFCATSKKVWTEEDEAEAEEKRATQKYRKEFHDALSPLSPFRSRRRVGDEYISWLDEGDEWAVWSSIGFCKIGPSARSKPLDRLFWQWIEHSINRSVGVYMNAGGAGLAWHIHWPKIEHHHNYEEIPDHLW